MINDQNCLVYVSEDRRLSMMVYGNVQILTADGVDIHSPTEEQIDAFAHEHGFYYEAGGKPYGGWKPWEAIAHGMKQISECWECPYSDGCEACDD